MSDEFLLWVHGETLLNGAVSDPNDYKIFCFDGEPRALYVATGRASGDVKFDFFDLDWNHLPFVNGHQNADCEPARPRHLDEMLTCARALSEGIPHVRVDFYEVGGKVYFGEMTFYHMSGLAPFDPEEWDLRLGSMLDLSRAFDCESRNSEISPKERLPL